MDASTILIAVGVVVGLVALLGGLIWFDVVKRNNPPPEPTGTVPLPDQELGPRWTPGS